MLLREGLSFALGEERGMMQGRRKLRRTAGKLVQGGIARKMMSSVHASEPGERIGEILPR